MGESASDFLVHRIDPVAAGALGAVVLGAALFVQFRAPRYTAWRYWLAVSAVAVFGTMAADGLHVELGVPYPMSTVFFAAVLGAVFVVWYRVERTLSIHSVDAPRSEAFYWATVIATFALGTAVGDLTATTLHLGYLASGLVFAVVIAVPGVAYRWFGMPGVPAFWFAYVITRPLGASFSDWFGMPRGVSGLGIGHGPVALVLTVLIAIVVAYVSVARREGTEGSPVPVPASD
jgi:uncharacterized membrane-anchored protein